MEDTVIVDESVLVETVEVIGEDTVSITEESIQIISEALQGPQGIPGPKGDKGEPGGTAIKRVAAGALGGHRMLLMDVQGRVDYASNVEVTHATRVIGMSTHAAEAGALVELQVFGEITEPSWNWETGTPVYLGANGLLTQQVPAAPDAKFSLVVGFPISATTLFINIGIPITLIQ